LSRRSSTSSSRFSKAGMAGSGGRQRRWRTTGSLGRGRTRARNRGRRDRGSRRRRRRVVAWRLGHPSRSPYTHH
jgi:hypothetical protein